MGVEYDSLLVFGIVFDYETARKIQEITKNEKNETDEEEDVFFDNIQVDEVNEFNELFPELHLGMSSPYYDSDIQDWDYYITMIDPFTSFTIADLNEIYKKKIDSYRSCLEKYGIEYKEPSLISLPHIS